MCFPCWITKATDTHSEYVILIALSWQHGAAKHDAANNHFLQESPTVHHNESSSKNFKWYTTVDFIHLPSMQPTYIIL